MKCRSKGVVELANPRSSMGSFEHGHSRRLCGLMMRKRKSLRRCDGLLFLCRSQHDFSIDGECLEQDVEAEPIMVRKCRTNRGPEIILPFALDDGECAVSRLVIVLVHDVFPFDGRIR